VTIVGIEIALVHAVNAVVARHPKRSLIVFENGKDGVGKIVDGGVPITHAYEAAVGADPERATGVVVKREDRCVAQNAVAAAS
jgi:hypothetical protein